MSRTIDAITDFQSFQDDDPTPAQQVQEQLKGKAVCPFCGAVSENSDAACGRCTMENSPLTRQATRARLGPWYVLQTRNPSAPGMKYSVLLSLVKKGQVTPRSIVRGPTTSQFWRFAARVRGLSRSFGICWGCGADIETTAEICPHCQRNQKPPEDPDQLIDGRQAISQSLPVQREIRPAFPEEVKAERRPVTPPPPAGNEMPLRHPSAQDRREPMAREDRREYRTEGVSAEAATSSIPRIPPAPVQPSRGVPPVLTPSQVVLRPRPVDPEPQQPLGRVLLLLVLMALFTVAGWLYADGATRAKVFAWVKAQWESVTGNELRPSSPVRVELNPIPDLKGQKIVTAPPASEEEPAVVPPVPEQAPPIEVAPPAVPPAAVVVPEPQPQARPAAPPVVDVQIDRAPNAPDPVEQAPVARPPAAREEEQAEVTVGDVNEAIRRSRALNRQAIDAEAAGDYVTAVKLYEQIERLPPSAWPGDLKLRLDYARRQLEKRGE